MIVHLYRVLISPIHFKQPSHYEQKLCFAKVNKDIRILSTSWLPL
uniref:Uncharacterized protein n=1 Tax=Arundo donax TaxID=35708 RepID=A0A0A9GI00_ARUDO